jgi:hypothetical protein
VVNKHKSILFFIKYNNILWKLKKVKPCKNLVDKFNVNITIVFIVNKSGDLTPKLKIWLLNKVIVL